VEEIGAKAFKNCKKLKSINIKSTQLDIVGKDAFRGIQATTVKVPSSMASAYSDLFEN
jgi:hypothetical protein